jgi:hypothetical protein
MNITVFLSWQSDTNAATGRVLLERALNRAVASVAVDAATPFRPAVDQDTRGIPGAPAMVAAILGKIDSCSIFVADVSLTFKRDTSDRYSPNPNVLLELGYALRRLGSERVLLLMDVAHGRPEQLPFDLRGNRLLTYDSGSESAAAIEASLAASLDESVRTIWQSAGPPPDVAPPIQLRLRWSKERIESARHDYRLHVEVLNRGTSILSNWALDLKFPRELLDPHKNYPIIQQPSQDKRVLIRRLEHEHSGPIFPGDPFEVIGIDYIMTHDLYDRRDKLFPMKVEASLYANGHLMATAAQLVKDLQFF